jgi:TrmH family RNA methyltransferase
MATHGPRTPSRMAQSRDRHPDSPPARSSGPRQGPGQDRAEFEHVTSISNDTVKLLRGLERKKGRTETGLFIAEGARLIEEGLRKDWSPAYVIAGIAALERPASLDLLRRARGAGARVLTCGEKILEAVSRKDNPQTIIAAFRQQTTPLAEIPASGERRWIALYEVRDPGNLGTVIRTADASGVSGLILVEKCCDLFSVETVRATMGSLFALPVAMASFEEFEAWRKQAGARMVAASMHGKVQPDAIAFGERSVVLMGNEQSGLPPHVEAACDELVRIPMMGSADSLNLASAASIMIYEAWRSRGFRGAA